VYIIVCRLCQLSADTDRSCAGFPHHPQEEVNLRPHPYLSCFSGVHLINRSFFPDMVAPQVKCSVQNVFSLFRMCSHCSECVLLPWEEEEGGETQRREEREGGREEEGGEQERGKD